jgi:hypothetical protein
MQQAGNVGNGVEVSALISFADDFGDHRLQLGP